MTVAVDNHVSTAYGAVEQVRHLAEKIVYAVVKHVLNLAALITHKVDVWGGVAVKSFFAAYREADNGTVGRQIV